jgi:hypothetical protein
MIIGNAVSSEAPNSGNGVGHFYFQKPLAKVNKEKIHVKQKRDGIDSSQEGKRSCEGGKKSTFTWL